MKINDIESKNILVVGDIMLDTYFTGEVKRISPEAPVPVFLKKGEKSVLGGAANVAVNLSAAHQNVSIMSIIGNDGNGFKLKAILETYGINMNLVFSLDRHTTEKIRLLAANHQQVIRMDVEDTDLITIDQCKRMLDDLKKQIHLIDLILISDYLKGLLTYDLTQGIIQLAKEKNIPVIIDVKDQNVEKYYQATLLKPNLKELENLTGRKIDTIEQIVEASQILLEKSQSQYVLTTCGARGMVLVGAGEPYFVDSVKQEVFDVTGAGDTAIAYIATCMVNGFEIREAVDIANFAAGIQVSKVGTSAVGWSEIRENFSNNNISFPNKIINGSAVEKLRRDYIDKKIVFTNGCFDILHIGHIRYLQEAAKLGDILIVGINSDDSVRRLKGTDRPVNGEMERAEMLSALAFIDYVTIFEEDTPLELIKKIEPDVLVKGDDYRDEYVVGTKEVEAHGGQLVLIPLVEGKSTTNTIKKIKS